MNVTNIECSIELIWLHQVNPMLNIFSGQFNFNCKWNDPRLAWNSATIGEKAVQLESVDIWIPTMEFVGVENGFQTNTLIRGRRTTKSSVIL